MVGVPLPSSIAAYCLFPELKREKEGHHIDQRELGLVTSCPTY